MKNLFLSLAFLLVGTFAFANAEVNKNTSDEIKTSIVENTIDFDTFTQMFDLSEIDTESITFDVIGGSFTHIDSCGNVWTVDYWGYSFFEVTQILFALDDLLYIRLMPIGLSCKNKISLFNFKNSNYE